MNKSYRIIAGAAAAVLAVVYFAAAQWQGRPRADHPGEARPRVESDPALAAIELGAASGPQSTDQPTVEVANDAVNADATPAAESEGAGATLDMSCAMRPFPLSESLRRTCAGRHNGASDCPELLEFLESFSQEGRDTSWASSIESRITTFVEKSRRDARVREVECRTDRCVLEVEAPYHFVITEFDKDTVLNRELREGTGDLGFEREAGKPEIVITVSTLFRRRPISR